MDFRVKGFSYGLLLSHTFPGLIIEIEAIVAFRFFTSLDISIYSLFFTDEGKSFSISMFVVTLAGIFIVATLLGIVIDGVHHCLWERKWRDDKDYEIFRYIRTVDQMQIYVHFIEDQLWYYYEAYANVFVAMVPGLVLLSYWLIWLLKPYWVFTVVVLAAYVFLLVVTFIEVKHTEAEIYETGERMLDAFKSTPDEKGA